VFNVISDETCRANDTIESVVIIALGLWLSSFVLFTVLGSI